VDEASGGLPREPDGGNARPLTRREAHAQQARRRRPAVARIPESVKIGVIAFAVMLLVRALVVQTFSVPSGSMQETLEPGDRILVSRLQRGPSIERGDVVVFDGTDTWGKPAGSDTASGPRQLLTSILAIVSLSSGADYVKRVVGVPGDHVVCCDVDGRLTVNGVAVDEPYLYPGNPPSTTRFDVTVPAGKIWVMGDHRSASADSRSQMGKPGGGMVPLDDVVGRAWVRYWPLDRLGSLTPAPTLHNLPLPTGAAPS
jgi:signal peptidase I